MVNRLLVNSRLLEFTQHARRLGDGGNQWGVEGEADSSLSLAVSPVDFEEIDGNSVSPKVKLPS